MTAAIQIATARNSRCWVRRNFAHFLFVVAAAIGLFGQHQPAAAQTPAMWMVRLSVDGQRLEGAPISWNERAIHLLGRDGRLWEFDAKQVTDYENAPSHFRGFSPSEFRSVLLRELGNDYEVTGTSHYLVAHPRGQDDKWAERFEDLYRAFVSYFTVRGLQPTAPPFPLVGIVCKSRADFVRQSTARGEAPPNGVLGYYNPESNRITLYDMGGRTDSASWKQNAGVLIHETTHQIAFNTGVHSRYALPPRWLAEGLAMLFEAPGVNNAQAHPWQNDRVNHDRLQVFRQWIMPKHRPELLAALVASDELFQTDPGAAYAEAWALTFYLVENEPAKYASYLKLTSSRPPFTDYPSAARMKDFASIFGSDWRMFEARFLRFIGDLR